jgi:1-acyl-sn-glycerol-3-phosphate acyltransferase
MVNVLMALAVLVFGALGVISILTSLWPLIIFGVLLILLAALAALVFWINFRIQKLSGEGHSLQERFAFASWLAGWVVPLVFNVKVEAKGLEYLDQVETGVLFPNHRSLMEIAALLKVVKRPHAYVAKKELDGIYLLSDGMRMIGCEFMDRTDVRQSVKVISNATKKAKEGQLMVIFPEGTRVLDKEMGLFKGGSFKVATKAKADIIPVTMYNTDEVAARWPRRTVIRLDIHPPIPFKEYEELSTNEIGERVEKIVKAKL